VGTVKQLRETGRKIRVSLAKTPRRLNVIHVTCDTTSSYVIDFRRALDFGEGVRPGKANMFSGKEVVLQGQKSEAL
jgi:hypothetical protein